MIGVWMYRCIDVHIQSSTQRVLKGGFRFPQLSEEASESFDHVQLFLVVFYVPRFRLVRDRPWEEKS